MDPILTIIQKWLYRLDQHTRNCYADSLITNHSHTWLLRINGKDNSIIIGYYYSDKIYYHTGGAFWNEDPDSLKQWQVPLYNKYSLKSDDLNSDKCIYLLDFYKGFILGGLTFKK